MRYRATLTYDGTAYQGFQRQIGDTPTVQLAVENAVTAVTGLSATVNGAGRTDSGVHATGQVIAFDVEWQHGAGALLRAINTRLPGDIALQDITEAPGFHPRFDALSRLYRYRVIQANHRQPLLRERAWHIWGDLDGVAMNDCAATLIGAHDFAAFGKSPRGENTARTVFQSHWVSEPVQHGTLWTYTVEANAFLQHMVRRIVWLHVAVGRGKMTAAAFEAMFQWAELPSTGSIAPPMGLTLEHVKYSSG